MYNFITRKVALTATILTLVVPNARGQWIKVSDTSIDSVNAMVENGGVLLAGTTSGFFTSTDSGSTWISSNSGLPQDTMYVTSLASEDTTVYAGILHGGVYKSTDFGKHWIQIGEGLISGAVWYIFAQGNLLFAEIPTQRIFRSTNRGISWDSVDPGVPLPRATCQMFFLGTTTFASIDNVFYQSNDSGVHWSTVNSPDVPVILYTSLIVGSTIYAGGYPGVFKSTDTGSTWRQVPSGLYILSLANFDSIIFAGTQYGNVLISNDNGMSWQNIGSGLPDTKINSLVTADGYLFAGTPVGLWRRPLSDFVKSNVASSNVTDSIQFFLEQSLLTVYSPSLIHSICLFDIMGRSVRSVESSGTSLDMDLEGLADGFYFVRVKTDAGTSVQKIVVR